MWSWDLLLSLVFVVSGAIIMFLGILKARNLFKIIPFIPKNHQPFITKNLSIHRILMVVFLAGYLLFAVALPSNFFYVSHLLVSAIMLLGAFFVFLTVRLQTRMLSELQTTLHGLLPICAHCKKILCDDKSPENSRAWTEIESYVMDHSDTDFSHGICPDCMEKYYPKYAGKMQQEMQDESVEGRLN